MFDCLYSLKIVVVFTFEVFYFIYLHLVLFYKFSSWKFENCGKPVKGHAELPRMLEDKKEVSKVYNQNMYVLSILLIPTNNRQQK